MGPRRAGVSPPLREPGGRTLGFGPRDCDPEQEQDDRYADGQASKGGFVVVEVAEEAASRGGAKADAELEAGGLERAHGAARRRHRVEKEEADAEETGRPRGAADHDEREDRPGAVPVGPECREVGGHRGGGHRREPARGPDPQEARHQKAGGDLGGARGGEDQAQRAGPRPERILGVRPDVDEPPEPDRDDEHRDAEQGRYVASGEDPAVASPPSPQVPDLRLGRRFAQGSGAGEHQERERRHEQHRPAPPRLIPDQRHDGEAEDRA